MNLNKKKNCNSIQKLEKKNKKNGIVHEINQWIWNEK